MYSLTAGIDYKIAIAHGEGWGGSRIRPWIKTPSSDWQIIDPSDPTQSGMFSVTFDGNITNEISPYTFVKHGVLNGLFFPEGSLLSFMILRRVHSLQYPLPHFTMLIGSI